MNEQTLITFAVFCFALGACIGSFLNVVIWRLPHRGELVGYLGREGPLTLSWPPSHCPNCDRPIRWYQNIPVLAWIVLRGRCANCRKPIAVRYPLVELATGLAFAGLFLAYYVGRFPHPSADPPEFSNILFDWPRFLLHLVLVACLLAASAIDADWFIIPLGIPALMAGVGLIASPLINSPAMPTVDPAGPWAWPTLGGAAGLLLANVLLWRKLIPQSFSEAAFKKEEQEHGAVKDPDRPTEEPITPLPTVQRTVPLILAVVIILALLATAWLLLTPTAASAWTLVGAILIFLLGILVRDRSDRDVAEEVDEEISVAGARREMLKEALFLAIPLILALAAALIPAPLPAVPWLGRLLGAMLGLLVGGFMIWAVRIGGTLLLGREAMGLGDVHLMAGVGAILGPMLTILVLPLACVVGVGYAISLLIARRPNVLPFGPWLSVASILALVFGKVLINAYLVASFGPKAPQFW